MSKNFASITKLCAVITWVVFSAMVAFAQSQATSGNIEGRVTDPNGAAVPGATVTATNQETGFAKTADTNGEGIFSITFLPPGKYRVTTPASKGFAAADFSNVTVTVGSKTPLEIQLALKGADTVSVDVSTNGEIVETTRTSVASTINERA